MKLLTPNRKIAIAIGLIVFGLSGSELYAQRPGNGGAPGGGRNSGGFNRGGAMAPSRNNSPQMGSRGPGISNRNPGIISPRVNSRIPNLAGRGPSYMAPRIGNGRIYSRPNYSYVRPGYRPYYRPNIRFYNYYRPFIGLRLNVLPMGFYPLYWQNNPYYYSDGMFYHQNNNAYEVVVPPVGAEVPSLPKEAQLITIDGVDYYEYKGVYYTLGTNADGKTVYVVAGKDGVLNTNDEYSESGQVGDIVDQLPEGSKEVIIKNEKYFISPDQVYYEVVMEGTEVKGYRLVGKGN